MNIFATDPCPIKSAKFLDDKRVVKMILESAQMLSTALRYYGLDNERLYKSTHVNHPCSIWVRNNISNYFWLLNHFDALCSSYTKKTGKRHKCESMRDLFLDNAYRLPVGEQTQFANCAANSSLNVDFKHIEDVCLAYKHYLAERWKYDKRKPTWIYGCPLDKRCPDCGRRTLTTFDDVDGCPGE